jgi:hypothetical protein
MVAGVAFAAAPLLAEPPVAAPASAPAAVLPTAQELLDRHVAAIGGREALTGLVRMSSKGHFEMPAASIKGPTTTYAEEPLRFVMIMELPGIGAVRTGLDNDLAWSLDPMQGPRLLRGKEFDQLRRDANFRRDLDLFKDYEKVEVKGETTFGGRAAYEVLCSGPSGETTMFFDKEEGVARGMRMVAESPLGQVPVETVFVEYRGFAGPSGEIRIPVRSEIAMLNQKQVLTIDSVSFDPIDPAVFELPKEIAALAAEAKAAKAQETASDAAPASAAPKQ